MKEWTQVAVTEDLPEGGRICADADGTKVVITRIGGELYCLKNECPHAQLPLGEGEINPAPLGASSGGTIVCPFHGYTFRLSDGADIDDPKHGEPVPVYETKEEAGEIFVLI